MRNPSDAGFTLIEVLVAFATATLGIVVLYSTLAGYQRQAAAADMRERILAQAQSQLDAVGISTPLSPGVTSGVYPNGASWRMTVAPIGRPEPSLKGAGMPMQVVLETFDAGGHAIVRLKTVVLGAQP